jgi:hypothetical protein
MNRSPSQSSQVLRLKHHIASDNLQLKLIPLAPPGQFSPSRSRELTASLELWKAQLRLREAFDLWVKFDPDQPRVPAGNPDGGQWSDATGSSNATTSSNATGRGRDATGAQNGNPNLSNAQRTELQTIVNNRRGNYVDAYRYLHRQVQDRLADPKLSDAERNELTEQEFWLRKAIEINGNDPNSQANYFIRSVTRNGLRFDDIPAPPEKIQENSNYIGQYLTNDVLKNGKIPAKDNIIANDAKAAIDKGNQTIGGWGGAFNYWETPLSGDPRDTVGNRISNDPAEYEKFISVNAKALADTAAKFGHYPDYALESLVQGVNAQVPTGIKQEILLRAIDGINGEAGGFAGDPYDIDGYHPHFDGNDNVVGWYSRDRRLKRIDVSNNRKIVNLTKRYRIRQSKGEFHPWQTLGED